ncbi:MAG: DMT family transporter [Thermoplasmata archaeon]|nr:DMT family transporter [Thermoplasmata archaeon]
MSAGFSSSGLSALMATAAAFLWSTYFFFVLAMTPGTAPSALMAYPFLIGGGLYIAWAVWLGHGRLVLQLFREPGAWLRVGLIVLMQLSVLGATYTAGAVNTSLLSLLGDAAMTPLLAMIVLGEGRHRARSPLFLGGLTTAAAGAALTILAGGTAGPFRGWALVIAPFVPLAVGAFFVLSAREGQRRPTSALLGHSTFTGGLVCAVIAGVVPGGWSGLVLTSPSVILLMIGLGSTSFFVATILYFAAISRSGIILPTLFQVLIPIFTLGLAALLLRQIPTPLGLLGIPIAVGGGILAYRGALAPEPVPPSTALLDEGGALAPDLPLASEDRPPSDVRIP